jgi:hypothetical protein
MYARACVCACSARSNKMAAFFLSGAPLPLSHLRCTAPQCVCRARGGGVWRQIPPPPFQQQQGATAALYPPGLVTSLGPTCHRTARQGFYGGPWGKGRGEGDFLREGGIWLSRQQGQAKEFDIFAVKCFPTWC